ncbi:MAG: DUF4129 domain-containing protein [Verrucomicrobiota bacterium]
MQFRKNQSRPLRKRKTRAFGEPTAVDIVEESIHILRRLSWDVWIIYGVGVSVFTFTLLYYWLEMSAGLNGESLLLPGAIVCACALIFFKVCQARMIECVSDQYRGLESHPWSLSDWIRCARRQCSWSSVGAWLLPIAFVLTIPFPRLFAFFQSTLCWGPRPDEDIQVAREWEFARIWPEQNWMLLTLLSIVWLGVFINLLSLIGFIPYLMDAVFGIETDFGRAGNYIFNSVSLFTCALLSYLATDPLTKVAYTLRRHYVVSQATGEDLLLGLRNSRKSEPSHGRIAASMFLAGALLWGSVPGDLRAQESVDDSELRFTNERISKLDQALEDTLERREFSWRFPKDEIGQNAAEGSSIFEQISNWIERLVEKMRRFLEDRFGDENDRSENVDRGFFDGFGGLFDLLLYLIILILACVFIYFMGRAWRQNKAADAVVLTDENHDNDTVNLEDEDVSADQLPRNRWLEVARELIAKGELRLALRAYFLAQLAELSTEGVIIVKRGKSNREYHREIVKKAHAYDGLVDLYRAQMRLFESVWYGNRPVGAEQIGEMETLLKRQGILS